jgi:hypothetical protein
MEQRFSRHVILAIVLSVGSQLNAQFPQIPGLGNKSDKSSGLNDTQISSGLKEALSVGTQKAVKLVAHPGGYLENSAIKILLPPNLRTAEKALRAAGQGPKIDEFVASMNHAAESAAPEAAKIFSDAVKQMTIEDARKLLNGGNTSITDYFKSKTSAELTTAFRPHVEAAMNANGVTQKYQDVAGRAPKLPFLSNSNLDINTYVVNKALDGLFYMLGKQEEEIRTNPAARSTSLLKQVFGSR